MDLRPDSLPVNKLDTAGQRVINPLRYPLLANWHLVLLTILTGLMIWMSAWLLWPQPATKIVLIPLSPEQLVVTLPHAFMETAADTEDADFSESEAVPSVSKEKKKSRRLKHSTTRKKPSNPPVLNLNTASLSQLQLLPGIGPKMAQRIVEYRTIHGAFQSPGQLTDVKGIGPRKLEKLIPFLKV
jgi:competence protein ComEA